MALDTRGTQFTRDVVGEKARGTHARIARRANFVIESSLKPSSGLRLRCSENFVGKRCFQRD